MVAALGLGAGLRVERREGESGMYKRGALRYAVVDILRLETLPVHGEMIEVDAEVTLCVTCGEEVTNMAMGDAILERAYAVYRLRHDIHEVKERGGVNKNGMIGGRNLTVVEHASTKGVPAHVRHPFRLYRTHPVPWLR